MNQGKRAFRPKGCSASSAVSYAGALGVAGFRAIWKRAQALLEYWSLLQACDAGLLWCACFGRHRHGLRFILCAG